MIKYSLIYLLIYALLSEYWLDISVANIRISLLFSTFIVIIFSQKSIFLFKQTNIIFFVYLLIIFSLLINDMYVGAKPIFIFKSLFFHLMSFATLMFFLLFFYKNEENFPKFLILFGLALLLYKNNEYLLNFSRVSEPAYFNSRLASLIIYITIGLAFFIVKKLNLISALILLVISFLLLYYMEARSSAAMLLAIIMLWIYTFLFKPSFVVFFITIFIFLFISLPYIFIFYPEIVNTIIIARIDTFSAILYSLENFPLGIGSGGIVDLKPFVNILSEFFDFSLNRVEAASGVEYSTAHSFLVGSLFKHGALSFFFLLCLSCNIFWLNIILLTNKSRSNDKKLLSAYIVGTFSYTILFSGYGQFLFQIPLFYAASISMFNNFKVKAF